MKLPFSAFASFLALLGHLSGPNLPAAPITHEFIAIDEGLSMILHVNERDPSKDWRVPTGQAFARDMQLIGNGRILIGHDRGYTEFSIATGKVLKEFFTLSGVTSVRRLENDHSLIAGVGLNGAKGVVLLELDAADTIRSQTVYPDKYVRMVRHTAKGTLLMACDNTIKEFDGAGHNLWQATVPNFGHAWKAVRLLNGHTFASAGYGGFMVELDTDGTVLRKFGGKETTAPAVNSNFFAMFQLLANGHVVVANWQGHGPGHGASGVQLLEFDQSGAIVWSWSRAELISSLQGVLVLDGLDTAVLHDERNGPMEQIRR
jgi:hypothetical protein